MENLMPINKQQSQFTPEGYDRINEALNAFAAYNEATTEEDRAKALASASDAISSFPGALYKNDKEFMKDFFSDSMITL